MTGAGLGIRQAPFVLGTEGKGRLGRGSLQTEKQESPCGGFCAWSKARAGGEGGPPAPVPPTLRSPLSIGREHTDMLGGGLEPTLPAIAAWDWKGLRPKAGGQGSAQPSSDSTRDLEQGPLPPWSLRFPTCRMGPWHQHAVGGVQCDIP